MTGTPMVVCCRLLPTVQGRVEGSCAPGFQCEKNNEKREKIWKAEASLSDVKILSLSPAISFHILNAPELLIITC